MVSIGTTLRNERERQRLSISNIAKELRITEQYLTAIEDDRIEELPGVFFYKSFVRQYARYMGLDLAELQDALATACESAAAKQQNQASSTTATAAAIVTGLDQQRTNSVELVVNFCREAADRIFSPGPSQRSASGGLAAVLILATAGIAGWVEWPQLTSPTVSASAPVNPNSQAASTATEESDVPPAPEPAVTSSDATVTEVTTISAPAASANQTTRISKQETASQVSQSSGTSLKLTATEATWLAVSDRGRLIFSGVLQAGETKTFPDLINTTLRLGNAGGIVAEWNGQPTGSLGHHGDVRTVRFTIDGFRILEPGGQL